MAFNLSKNLSLLSYSFVILFLRYFAGKTQMEISNEIGISQAQVSRREKDALKEIKANVSG